MRSASVPLIREIQMARAASQISVSRQPANGSSARRRVATRRSRVTAIRIATAARVIRACLTVGLATVLMVAGRTGPAHAADTTPDERAVVLIDSAVVYVDTSVDVAVRLSYEDFSQYSGKSTLSKRYHFAYSSGSGFVVNPSGIIVTASHVVEPVESDIRNYAANKLLVELDKSDNPFDQYTLRDQAANNLLQQCYDGSACDFKIDTSVDVYTPVQIAGISAPKPLSARILKSTGFKETDVAVLQVDGGNMPTVPLATTANELKSGQSLIALGFPGSAQDLPTGFTEPAKLFGRVSNIRSHGPSKLVEASITGMAHGMSGGPGVNDDGKVIGLVSFSSLDEGARAQAYLRTVDDIRAALRAAGGVQAARGEVDTLFDQAMGYFWEHHYSATLPLYQEILNLYDGHPLAKKYLAEAQAKAGGPEDVPLATAKGGSDRSRLLVPGVAALVALAAAVTIGGLLLRRRRALRRQRRERMPAPAAAAGGGGGMEGIEREVPAGLPLTIRVPPGYETTASSGQAPHAEAWGELGAAGG